jgi:3-oxoacyl-(acyl-carrier-protein) synthase
MERRVVVTGIGVISPLGDSPVALHTALCEGRSSLQPITLFNTDGLVCKQAHALASFTPEIYLGKKNLRAKRIGFGQSSDKGDVRLPEQVERSARIAISNYY